MMAKNAGIRWVLVYTMGEQATADAVAGVSAALAAGALSELPAIRFPLEEISAAHDAVRDHAVGKVLVELP